MKIEQKFLTMKIEEEKSDSLDDRVNSTANKEKGKFMSWEKREREREIHRLQVEAVAIIKFRNWKNLRRIGMWSEKKKAKNQRIGSNNNEIWTRKKQKS